MRDVIGVIVVLVGGGFLLSSIRQARTAAWAGPRTEGMRMRSMAATPGGRHLLRQAKADAHTLWEKARAADWLEERRHGRALMAAAAKGAAAAPQATGNGAGATPAARSPGIASPPPAPAQPAQAAIVNGNAGPAPAGRATTALRRFVPGGLAQGTGTASGSVNGSGHAPASATPAPSTAPTTGGNTVTAAGTSTASAEKLIEGINEIHAHAAAGGIHAKREAVRAIHEACIRLGQMLGMLSRHMSEPDANYGHEITEPLAKAADMQTASAMSASESDAAITTLINMTVGDLAASARRAPNHNELNRA